MSRRRVHRIRLERKRRDGKPMWHVYCTCGRWFQWVFGKADVKRLGDEHLEKVKELGRAK